MPSRFNKCYRAPPTPPPEVMLEKEKTFVLDGNAVESVAKDWARSHPKLGPVIPPYNSQRDKLCDQYFKFVGVDKTLGRTGQDNKGDSIEGAHLDKFHLQGAGIQYMSLRNQHGAGHSREWVDGHAQFMQGVKPITNWHGQFGYRRNTPWLRKEPSPFGTASRSPSH